MTAVDLSKLPDFLKAQRWFAGKAWPIKSVSVVDHAAVAAGELTFELAIVEVVYELGHPERYLLPVQPRGSSGGMEDALDHPECLRALFRLIRHQEQVPSASARVQGEWCPPADLKLDLPEPVQVRRLQVEQSNTSVVVGEQVILKVIRKLEAGVNPEYEVGRFLATRTRFRATPTLVGALLLEGPALATLALVHRFVPNATDGWRYTLDTFRRARTLDAAFLGQMRDLGARLGELHVALASDPSDKAFAPEDIHQEDLQRWSASIAGELGVTLAQAQRAQPELEQHRERLLEAARQLAHVPPSGKKIRVHGDLHLGQTLRTPQGWLIFDFEGEPGRSFSQRREKYSPLKDVAGMLRSFDYAAAAVELEGGEPGERVGPAREAFLEGYRAATRGAAWLPAGGVFDVVLNAFEMEKLLYEVRYELANRPDWVRIPIRALLRMEAPK